MKFILGLLLLFSFTASAAPNLATYTQLAPINLTSAGTRQALSATAVYVSCVAVQAVAANTGVIYLGDVAVTSTNGYVLQKGDTAVLCADGTRRINLAALYIDGGTTNDDVKVMYSVGGSIGHVPKPL